MGDRFINFEIVVDSDLTKGLTKIEPSINLLIQTSKLNKSPADKSKKSFQLKVLNLLFVSLFCTTQNQNA